MPIPAIIPRPMQMSVQAGSFSLNVNTHIVVAPKTRVLGKLLQGYLCPGTGLPLELSEADDGNTIRLRLDPSLKALGPEGYRLVTNGKGVEIRGAGPAGIFYGIQTLRQLLPASSFRKGTLSSQKWGIPFVQIQDKPRFSWRGAMIDTSRHFMPKEYLLRFIDGLALHKLNSFHLHLTDDQGWRMEVKKYPKLTQIGSWHRGYALTNDPTTVATMPEGGFYTQDDLREIVAYAKARYVNVMPEIEMPGHSFAIVVAYPELGNTGKQFELRGVNQGTDDIVNVGPEVVKLYQDVLTEVMDIFPSKFIHVGGDEVWKGPWQQNPKMQAQMKALNLKDENELQSWFIRQMDTFLTQHGRRLVGWDEILEGGLAPGATVMSWRGIESGVAAAKAGHDVIMAPTSHTYLDYYQAADHSIEPQAIGGLVTLEKVYSFDPVPPTLTAMEASHVLGTQGQLWTEYIPNPTHLDYMAYPRLCALAEVAWSPLAGKSYADFLNRLPAHLERLTALDIPYRPLNKVETPPAGGWKPGDVTETYGPKVWNVTASIKGPGAQRVRFQYLEGGCRLSIEWAELLVDGRVVARDEHLGLTGSVDSANTFDLVLKEFRPGAKYELRASVRTDGGTDSTGEIRIRSAAF